MASISYIHLTHDRGHQKAFQAEQWNNKFYEADFKRGLMPEVYLSMLVSEHTSSWY